MPTLDPGRVLTFAGGVILGLLLSLIPNLIANELSPWFHRTRLSWGRKMGLRRMKYYAPPSPFGESFNLGGFKVDWHLLAWSTLGYRWDDIKSSYDPIIDPAHELPEDLRKKRREFEVENITTGKYHNSKGYKLIGFRTDRHEMVDIEERPILDFAFGPTDFYTEMVTDRAVGEPIRERYKRLVDVRSQPIPQYASIVGVNVNIITSDGYLIVTKRSPLMMVARGKWHTSIHEHVFRPEDEMDDGSHAPNLFKCALRGGREELGLEGEHELHAAKRETVNELGYYQLQFSAFGVEPHMCSYSLFGWSRINMSAEDFRQHYSSAPIKDKSENDEIDFVKCDPDIMAKYFAKMRNEWFPLASVCAIISLYQMNYSYSVVRRAFARAMQDDREGN